MTSWLAMVTGGEPAELHVDAFPEQERVTPDVTTPEGFARWEWQTGFLVCRAFGGYLAVGSLRRFRRRHPSRSVPHRARMYARGIAGIGLLTASGVYYMMGSAMMSSGNNVGVVISGRPAV